MDVGLEFDEAAVRGVAATLTDSAAELSQLADRLDAALGVEFERFGRAVREWADRTASDAARLTAAAAAYTTQDTDVATVIGRSDS